METYTLYPHVDEKDYKKLVELLKEIVYSFMHRSDGICIKIDRPALEYSVCPPLKTTGNAVIDKVEMISWNVSA